MNTTVQYDAGRGVAPEHLLSWVYRDYCRQWEAGNPPDPDEYSARFPAIQGELAKLLSIHRLIHADSQFTAPPPEPPPTPVHRWPQVGEEFAGFRLERELGRGSFAHVFLATEPALGQRRVVVKIAKSGSDEALTLGRLWHPHIVPVFSVRTDEATRLAVVCMQYLGEATLADVVLRVRTAPTRPRSAQVLLDVASKGNAGVPLSQADAAAAAFLRDASYVAGVRRLALQLFDALAFIHGEGVCHRDLKPSNVLLTRGGVPMLLDFNLSDDVRHERTGLGGTLPYIAPEQLERLGQDGTGLDGRADLFALGVILFELLTGRLPFAVPARGSLTVMQEQLLQAQAAGAPPVRSLAPAVDRRLAAVIDRCLAFDRAARPPSARAASMQLQPWPARLPRRALARRASLALGLAIPLLFSGGSPPETRQVAAVAAAPRNALDASQECWRRGQFSEARAHLDRHLRLQRGDARAWLQRGKISLQMQQADLAALDFSEADRLQPRGVTKAWLGCAFYHNKQMAAARHCFAQAILAGYDNAAIRNNLGYLHARLAALTDAERELSQAIAAAPQSQPAYFNRGNVYLRQALRYPTPPAAPRTDGLPGRAPDRLMLERALADFQVALTLGPPSADLHADIAQVYAYLAGHEPALANSAIDHLGAALRGGLDPARAARPPFAHLLADNSRYALLCRQPPAVESRIVAQRFMALPLDD